jgi:hypothetical protein
MPQTCMKSRNAIGRRGEDRLDLNIQGDTPERHAPRLPTCKLCVLRSSLRLRVCKRIAYARSRNTATASTSKNSSAGTMDTRFISQSGTFKITISKSGPVIASFLGWNTKDDDGDERPTTGCPRGRD